MWNKIKFPLLESELYRVFVFYSLYISMSKNRINFVWCVGKTKHTVEKKLRSDEKCDHINVQTHTHTQSCAYIQPFSRLHINIVDSFYSIHETVFIFNLNVRLEFCLFIVLTIGHFIDVMCSSFFCLNLFFSLSISLWLLVRFALFFVTFSTWNERNE